MALERSFSTQLPPPDVWACISDIEQLAGAMPGLSQVVPDDTGVSAKLVLRVGAQQVTYTGHVTVKARERARRLRLAAAGTGARGSGEAAADVQIRLDEAADGTTVTVTVTPSGSGRIETFDREALQASGERLLDRFVAAIDERLPVAKSRPAAKSGPATEPEPAASEPEPAAEPEPAPAARSDAAPEPEPAAQPEPAPAAQRERLPRRRPTEREPATEHLATVTSISDVVRSRSRARRGAAASAVAMVAAVIALWLVHRRNAH